MSYAEKLKDSRWQQRRLQVLEAAGWKCTEPCCQFLENNPTLHVHHKVYIRGLDPWEYEDWALQVLCENCHKINQEIMQSAHVFLAKNPHFFLLLDSASKMTLKEIQTLEDGITSLVFFSPEIRGKFLELFKVLCMSSSELVTASFSCGTKYEKDAAIAAGKIRRELDSRK